MTTFSSIAGRAVLLGIVVCLMQSPGKAVSQESGTVGIAAAAATPDSRLGCPSDAKVDEAVKLIRAAYEEAYETAKDTGEPDPLIEQLTALADQATDAAKKYALLLEAEAIATQYENHSTALDLLEKRAQRFRIDGLKLRSQLLKRLAGPKVAADLVLFDQASDTAEKAMQAERFDVASEAAGLAVSVAKAIDREQKAEAKKRGRSVGTMGKDEAGTAPIGAALVKKATASQLRVNAAQKLFAEYGKALTHMKSEPDDAAANSVVAKYLCFVRGEWEKGLPALAKSDLESLKSVAATEISLLADGKRDTKQVFDLAGAWWAASESKDLNADQESAVKDHAAGFYADVADSLSDLLEKQLAKSRLRGLDPKAPNRGNQPTVFDFSQPNQLERFTVGGVMRETRKGLEFPGRGSSWVDSRKSFAGPLEATFVASTFPDINLDCYVGIFSSQPLMSFLQSGIHLHWGCFGNTRTLLYVFGNIHEIRHRPIEAGRDYRITLRVSKERRLTVLIDELIIHQEVLPSHLKLEGSVRCGGGIGHVLYRSATVVTGQAAVGIKAAEPVENALEQIVYLSDLPEIDPVVGYGVFGKNGELGYEGLKIVVGGEPSPKGISVHPFSNGMSRVTYKVPEGCTHFEGRAAIADGRLPQQTAVIFRVLNEQEDVLWKSRPLKGKGAGEECSIALNGAKTVTLTVECPGIFDYAYAVWVEPRFKTVELGRLSTNTPTRVVYLSDLPELEAKVVHFGFGKGTIRGEKDPIRSIIDGQKSPHGLSMHPGDGPNGNCFVKYSLPKGAKRFTATTTLDKGGSFDHCGIGFEVIADGKSVWKSKTINKDNQVDKCDIAIEDCRNLELRTYTVTKAYGGHAVWIEPCLTFGGSEQPGKASRSADAIVWETNGHAYKVFPVKESISWTDAQQRCVDMGGSLACGESEEEYAFLYKLKGGVRVWLGGREVNGKWLWTTGKPAPIPAGNGGDNKFLATTRGTDGGGRIARPDLAEFVEGFICEWPGPQVPSEVK